MQIPETEIIVTKDGAEVLRKTVRPGDYVIGRDEGCELQVEVELVSRRHAQLTVNFDHALIEDLGSSNGTFVTGQPVTEPTRLWPNQKIQVGAATVELHRLKSVPPPDESLAPQTAAVQRLLPEDFLREKKYEIGEIVAQGGMGAILDAKDATTERRVAMKVMLDGSSPADLNRFVAEAKVTAQLEHPSIVPVYELSVDENGQVFYTMKMVRGITLRKVLELLAASVPETVKKYPLPALLTIFQKVCDALAFAHSKGVIHRDLKPENIMLDDFGVVLVMDWGLAKVLGKKDAPAADSADSRIASARNAEPEFGGTLAGAIMGTPQYMSPEQARGEVETLDARSDIYAAGAILYHILALRPPVTGDSAMEVVDKVGSGEVEPLTAPKPSKGSHLPGGSVPDSLAAVVRKAMAFERDRRYGSVSDLQRDLTAYQNGFATSAENAGAFKQLTLLVRRHKGIAGTASAAWLVIIALGIWFVVNVTHAKKQAENERDRANATLTELRGTAPTFAAQAQALVDAGKPDDALAKLGYAIQLDEKNPGYQLQRAHLLESGQRLVEAAAGYHLVLAVDPTNRSARDNLALCERLTGENGGAPQLRRELQVQLVDALVHEGRAVEAGPLAVQLGQGGAAIEASLRARLKEYAAQPGWNQGRITRQLNGTFRLDLQSLKLGDLFVLKGLPISILDLAMTDFKDLSIVAGLPLKDLRLSGTQVSDLTPLRGLKLEKLDIGGCRVSNLEPLRGMPLRSLNMQTTQVTDLAALAGMPLEYLEMRNCNIKSLVALHGLPLRSLGMAGAGGDIDMANLVECRELEEVVFSRSAGNIEALRVLPKLARLRLEGYQEALIPAEKFWAEFKPEMEAIGTIRLALKGVGAAPPPIIRLPDGSLDVSLDNNNRAVSDLGFLHGLPISRLSISHTKVRDLMPLRGLPLKALDAVNTALTDLEPLRGLPLTEVNLYGAQVPSLAPLQDCPTLESIVLPRSARDIEKLRLLPKLRLISFGSIQQLGLYDRPDKTAEQFWKEYDAQQAAAKK